MHRLVSLIVATAAFAPSIAFADKNYNQGSGGQWDCGKDPTVTVNVGDGTFKITGACKRVKLNGNGNKLAIEATERLDVNGNANTIDVKQADAITVAGNDNKVSYGNLNAKIKNPGRGNILVAASGDSAPAPAAKPKDKPAADDSRAIDCSKTATFTIPEGDGSYRFVGTCDKISVAGGENRLTIEAVKELVVAGADNTIDVGAVDRISAAGNDNKIRYKTSVSGGKTKVVSAGQHNTIEQQ